MAPDYGLKFLFYVNQNTRKLKQLGFDETSLGWLKTCPTPTTAVVQQPLSYLDIIDGKLGDGFVTMNLPTLAILARRLGLRWITFDEHEGNFSAIGDGVSLQSKSSPQSSRTYVEYRWSQTPQKGRSLHLTIPSPAATAFLFGFIPPFPLLSLPGFFIGPTKGGALTTGNILKLSHKMCRTIEDAATNGFATGFWDLIPLASPMMRMRGSAITSVPSPTKHPRGLMENSTGFEDFRHRLGAYIADKGHVSGSTLWVQDQHDKLKAQFPKEWEAEMLSESVNSRKHIPFLERCQDVWDECTAYFVRLDARHVKAEAAEIFEEEPGTLDEPGKTGYFDLGPALGDPGFSYLDLISAHLQQALESQIDLPSISILKDRQQEMRWCADSMRIYWKNLPRLVAKLRDREHEALPETRRDHAHDAHAEIQEARVHEAWFVMMLRAFCWSRCHTSERGWKSDDWFVDDGISIDPGVMFSDKKVYVHSLGKGVTEEEGAGEEGE